MKVYVCLTTIPHRIGLLGDTLWSLASQSVQPDYLRLYAGGDTINQIHPKCRASDWFPTTTHLRFIVTEDIGPLTKLSAIQDIEVAPDDLIVTIDDDRVYERDWLKTLLAGAEQYPNAAVGFAGWSTKTPNVGLDRVGVCDVLEGWAGIAYRAKFFKPDVLDIPGDFKWVDDVWISAYLNKAGIERRIISHPPMCKDRLGALPGLHHREDFAAMNAQAVARWF